MLPTRDYDGNAQAAAGDVHPDFRTRKQHLLMISFIRRLRGEAAATAYWLEHCPRISKKAYQSA